MNNDSLSAYGEWVEELIDSGMKAHFVTFMFNPLSGGVQVKRARMEEAITETYRRILTRTVRYPKAIKNRNRLPILIAAFDLPVFKYDKDHLADIAINDGLHVHGIWLMPPKTRLEGDLSGEFLSRQFRYAGPGRQIRRIVSERIDETPRRLRSMRSRRSIMEKLTATGSSSCRGREAS